MSTAGSSSSSSSTTDSQPPGYNRMKRHWSRRFLWVTAVLLILDRPFWSTLTSAAATYAMHGGTWFSHKNWKWMSASFVSFLVSLWAWTLRAEASLVDGERAYELKMKLWLKHRGIEVLWGGILLLCLFLTVKHKQEKMLKDGLKNAVADGIQSATSTTTKTTNTKSSTSKTSTNDNGDVKKAQ